MFQNISYGIQYLVDLACRSLYFAITQCKEPTHWYFHSPPWSLQNGVHSIFSFLLDKNNFDIYWYQRNLVRTTRGTMIYQSPVNGSCQTEYIPQCQILYFMNHSASFALRAHNIDQKAQHLRIFIHRDNLHCSFL